MLKSLFTTKPFIIAMCIFIFVCAACFMYYNAVSLQISKDTSEHEADIRPLAENTNENICRYRCLLFWCNYG